MSFELRKPAQLDHSALALPHVVCEAFASKYPALAAYWFASSWPGGEGKKPATLKMHAFNNRAQATFNLIGSGLRLVVELEDPLLVYDQLEALLSVVSPPWQADPFNTSDALLGQAKKKKGK